MNKLVTLLTCSAALLIAVPASAHLELMSPTSRYGGSVLKTGPCGMGDGPRSDNVTTFTAGETITIEWDEYINHPGHYRIAFDDDGQDDFVDPNCLSNCDNRDMEIELYTNDAVLMDGIEDKQGGMYSVELTLPNVTCDNCTLQVIQVMTDKPPYTIGGNDNYYQCADLVLVAGEGGDDMGMGGDPDMGTGGDPDMGSGGDPDMGATPGDDAGAANNDNNTGGPDNNETGQPDAGGMELPNIENPGDEGGCCATANGSRETPTPLLALLLGFALFWRRR